MLVGLWGGRALGREPQSLLIHCNALFLKKKRNLKLLRANSRIYTLPTLTSLTVAGPDIHREDLPHLPSNVGAAG